MFRDSKSGTRLYCFSPPVMIATFVVETTMALYTIWRYRLTVAARLIVAALGFLGLFQLSEYFVCGGWGMSAMHWSRVGYVAITTLPPLGFHLLHVLAHKPKRHLVWTAYITMLGFMGYFLVYHDAFRGYQCTGNYVIFQLGARASIMYGTFYYSWLLAAIGLGIRWLGELAASPGKVSTERRNLIRALITGYMVFLIPTAVANSVNPATRRGIPSIMCGFAVLFAAILAFYILPRVGRPRH